MKIRIHLKIFVFIAIFIATRQIEIYGILMLFATLHELGHMLTGILLGFKPNTIEILPVGLSIGFEVKVDDYNKKIKRGTMLTLKKLIIALGGPITNLIFILIYSIFDISFLGINRILVLYSNILLMIFNLIPIYPLDGGRIIKGVLHIFLGKNKACRYVNSVSKICICIITATSSIAILYLKNISILLILAYLWYLVIRENKYLKNKEKLYNRIEQNKY